MVAAAEDDLDKQHADEGYDELDSYIRRKKKVPCGDVYEAARAGDIDRLKILLESGINVNARDEWDSVALYYACLAGHEDAARILLEGGAICSEHTFDGDRCHYAALNLRVRRLLKLFEARPPPLAPLPDSLRALFFRSGQNHRFLDPTLGDTGNFDADELGDPVGPDIVFYAQGQPIAAHRAILSARCRFFQRKFEKEWKSRSEIRFSRNRLSFHALFRLISFFYCDVLDVAVDDMEDLLRICKVCGCSGLQRVLEKELVHQKFADYKSLNTDDDSLKIREFCLDTIAVNFESFAATSEFKALLQRLPPPSGDTSTRTTIPNAPGGVKDDSQGNLLDDLRERWLEAEGAELDQRDESARDFDKVLELLRSTAENDDTESLELV
ncbi:BTB/POZ domain-containing protein At2g04740 [Selaginella moellendorffii]|uniref:BTB/POZ domain-containing protein At2g04740 n=1 Tax=Selaginella moellendorffii TaxID=88036 RepID=UPI000D1C8B6E|nr:BTB/POZ domain-containing protein At2g04740 [Selaginella moellendorffii]|eukprot:XP_024537785.1 BTB/POZ domain-containing protein At2g04740 [Selaginella moellendorffii]